MSEKQVQVEEKYAVTFLREGLRAEMKERAKQSKSTLNDEINLAMEAHLRAVPMGGAGRATSSDFESLDAYREAIKKLMLSRGATDSWANKLLEGDDIYIQNAYEQKEMPVAVAFEVYLTEEESQREPQASDLRLKLELSAKAEEHLAQLVKLGLWGGSVEAVAEALVNQALASKLEAGLLKTTYQK